MLVSLMRNDVRQSDADVIECPYHIRVDLAPARQSCARHRPNSALSELLARSETPITTSI